MTAGLVTDTIITNNWGKRYGGGIYATGGTVRRCWIENNTGSTSDGGIYHPSGSVLIEDCTFIGHDMRAIYSVDANIIGCTFISNIISQSNSAEAGSLYAVTGIVDRCTFLYSDARKYTGTVWMGSGVMRNCLIAGINSLDGYERGAVRLDTGAVMENCTVVGNAGGGIYFNGGVASNTISIFNSSGNAASNYYSTAHFEYSCTLPNPPSGTGNVPTDPLFIDRGSGFGLSHVLGDYTLAENSPCFNKGADLPWMQPPAKDLAGNDRIQGSHVDIGAYELAAKNGGIVILIL